MIRQCESHGDDRRLSVMFAVTSLTYGGAETLLTNLIQRIDQSRFAPELCCIKRRGYLGEQLSEIIPTHAYGLRSKYDVRVLPWMTELLRRRRADVLVTVGAGDKMFWGRLAARRARVPVIVSALHTTGWPDRVGCLNSWLTPLNDAFVGVAQSHGRHLVDGERFPAEKVHVIPNGVDVDRFSPGNTTASLKAQLGLPADAPVAGIVARLDRVKNHEMFLRVAVDVRKTTEKAQFLIVGDGPRRSHLESMTRELNLDRCVHFVGERSDIPDLLRIMDVFVLTSHIEANPVSILEAAATGLPVIATDVGSVSESVLDGRNGFLIEPDDQAAMHRRIAELFNCPDRARQMGAAGREHVIANWSLEQMVAKYEALLSSLYDKKKWSRKTTHHPSDSRDVSETNTGSHLKAV